MYFESIALVMIPVSPCRRVWREMGEPDYLNAMEVEQLQSASRLVREPHSWKYEDGSVQLDLVLPPHGVATITIE